MGEFIIWLLLFAIVCMVINSFKPKPPEPEKEPEKPKEKPEGMTYQNEFKAKIAVDSLKGKSDEDIIKEHPTITAEEIKEWKDDTLNILSKLSEDNTQNLIRIARLHNKVEWLEKTCKTAIGDDWKEKTGYKYL